MQFLKHFLLLIILGSVGVAQAQVDILYRANEVGYVHTFTDNEVIPRLRTTQSAVPTRYTDVVKGYLRTYTIKNREKTERILGKAVMYFPIFEEQLKRKGLPDALKYLSVTESALNPVAVSSAKAVGLWQFMKATGKEYGLRIDKDVDERCDPHLSTAAAAAYLERQYNRFGDWALAIAAYNSGPGNVSKAIRRGRSKNFWKIKKYLPRETRSYVPGYIAAAYILQHYEKHGLVPQYPEMDLQLTEAIKVYSFLNFQTVSAMTGLPVRTIRELNPSFLQNYIPATQRGYFLILPKRVMADFKNQVARPDSRPVYVNNTASAPIYTTSTSTVFNNANYSLSHHTVQTNEHLNTIAKIYNCHPYHIRVWNDLKSSYVKAGQQLKIYTPKSEALAAPIQQRKPQPKVRITVPTIQPRPIGEVVSTRPSDISQSSNQKRQATRTRYQYHIIHRNESLREIAVKYGTPLEQLIGFNKMKNGRLPMPGDKIKVRRLD